MLTTTPIRQAVADAVQLVNANAGKANIHLLFRDEPELDFVANAARIDGEVFEFTAGIESFSGRLEELAGIRSELIS